MRLLTRAPQHLWQPSPYAWAVRWGWVAGLLGLSACRQSTAPPSEAFQFPMAAFLWGTRNDFWDAVLTGMQSRLNLPGMQLEPMFFRDSERAQVEQRLREGSWRAAAFCVPASDWAKQVINQTVRAGIPVVLLGVDIPDVARLGYVGTYYYEAGRRAGMWHARRLGAGEVGVVAGHPVPHAVSEFWEGFRHGLLLNRRVRARLIPVSSSRQAASAVQKLQGERQIRSIFLMGAEVALHGMSVAQTAPIGVLSWRESAREWYLAHRIDLLILERPQEIGMRVANLMRNLSQGRGSDFQVVYTPFEWRAR